MSTCVFVLDKPLSIASNTLVIKLQGLPSSLETNAVDFLKTEEVCFPAPKNPQIYRIRHSQAIPALKLLAATGKLQYEGKFLACDFFSTISLEYRVTKASESLILEAFVVAKEWACPLSQCHFIAPGPPSWCIKGNVMRILDHRLSLKDIERFSKPTAINPDELQLLIDNFQDGDAPKVTYDPQWIEEHASASQPLPYLVLKDRAGACADLWMEYPGSLKYPLHELPIGRNSKRNSEVELGWERDLLETSYQRKMVGSAHYYCPVDKIGKSIAFLLELGWRVYDHQGRRIIKHSSSTLECAETSQTLVLKGKIGFANYEADLKDVLGAFNKRETFVSLNADTVGLLPDRTEAGVLSILSEESEVVSDSVHISKSHMSTLGDLWNDSQVSWKGITPEFKQRILDWEHPQEVLPSMDFTGYLRPYQQEGMNWIHSLFTYGLHGLLADDMGLGKTVQVLAFLSRIALDPPVLIVVPTSLLFNWQREIERFLPHIPVYRHHGATRSSNLPSQGCIITSYAILRLDFALFSNVVWQCLILDEAQVMKNPQTQIAQTLYRLQARMRLSITGTPIENHPSELWSHFHFLLPELLGDYDSYMKSLQAGQADARHLRRIQKRIRPFLLRRRKEDVAKDLPERIDQIVWIAMDPAQKAVYENFLSGLRNGLLKKVKTDGLSSHRMEILEGILRLRQICCHPLLVQQEGTPSSKLDTLIDDLHTLVEEGRKALVYSQFTSMLQLMGKHLQQEGIPYLYLDGSTTNRESIVAQFQEDPQMPIFLISLKAGGVGLNLTAADVVFIYDPWWNDAVENQAIHRAHRIGRKNTVMAKKYVMAESIEEKMLKLKSAKTSLSKDILEGDWEGKNLSGEDLLFLLED